MLNARRIAVAGLLAGLHGALAAQTPPPQPGLKHLVLDDSGVVWVALSAQSRTRVESWRNFGFGSATNHDADYVLQRLLASADLHLGPQVRALVEVKSALLTDRDLPGGRRPADADDIDLQQGYLELTAKSASGAALALRGGRQDLLFGKQRLVSPLDWANTRRTFDALRGTLSVSGWTLDAFYAHPVRVLKSEFNRWDGTVDFAGLYAQRRSQPIGVDLYWLALGRDAAAFNGTTGRERRQTVGARAVSAPGRRVELDVEVAYQFGSLGPGSVAATMVSADVAYSPARAPLHARLHAGLDYASGDGATGGDVGTFNQLFPLGHAFLGFIDVIGRQNIVAANVGLGGRPGGRVVADLTVHHFARAAAADALYNAAGAVERPAGTAQSLDLGTELDLTVAVRLGSHATALLGYSRFLAGAFVQETGAAQDVGFLYATVQLTY